MSTIQCPRCRGTGSHSHRFGVITSERIEELGEDFMESYAGGLFDEPCEVCDATGVTERRERVEIDLADKWC